MKELSSLPLLISSIIQECSLKKLIGGDEFFKSQSAGLPFVLIGLGKMAYCLSREIRGEDLLVEPFIVTKKIPSNPSSENTRIYRRTRVKQLSPMCSINDLKSNLRPPLNINLRARCESRSPDPTCLLSIID